MNDEQIEAALRRYQPGGPNPSLRSMVIRGRPARVSLGWVDWTLVAAAASLMFAILWPTAGPTSDPLTSAYRDRIDDVAEALGGDAQARAMAVIVLAAQPQAVDVERVKPNMETRP